DGDGAIEAELFDAVSEEALDDTEVAALERRDAQLRGVELTDADEFAGNPMGALLQPAAVAAREQRQEASRAIELQDYGVAVAHLRRAVELKPLDIKSNYWLAQLYIALGRKDRLAEDRKSTRLNSSHVKISYAVFCLKKKNKIQEEKDIKNVLLSYNIAHIIVYS